MAKIKLPKKTSYISFVLALKSVGLVVTPEKMVKDLFENRKEYPHINKIDFFVEIDGKKLAIEIEGGAFSGGRHTRPVGFINDMLKYNAITAAGVKLLRFTPTMVNENPVFCANYVKLIATETITTKQISDFTAKFKILPKKKSFKTKYKKNDS